MKIDLNADVGEGFASDAALIPLLSSANICCGAHAGSLALTAQTIAYCQQFGVRIGAHPSYPDRTHFGRLQMTISASELAESLRQQLADFQRLASAYQARVSYVKAHGALYNELLDNDALAALYLEVIDRECAELAIMTMPYGALYDAARLRNKVVITEGFADRRYRPDGRLTSRQQPDALLSNVETFKQATQLAHRRGVDTASGPLSLQVDSICLHGDNPHAVAQAKQIRQLLLRQGFCIEGVTA